MPMDFGMATEEDLMVTEALGGEKCLILYAEILVPGLEILPQVTAGLWCPDRLKINQESDSLDFERAAFLS